MAQTAAFRYQDCGDAVDYTPAGAVTGGDVVVIGQTAGIATQDIAASDKGSLAIEGVFGVPKTSDTFAIGDPVYWDTNGTPVTGDASSGAAGSSKAIGRLMGEATAAALTGDTYVYVNLNKVARNTLTNNQGDPVSKTVANTMTAADLLSGLITATPTATGATAAYTLPTGTLMDAAGTFAVNDSFDWTIINSALAAADTITITAGDGHTVVGVMTVPSLHASTGFLYGNAVRFRTRKTAANTFVTYRLC